ncbi:MAG: metallophosphoesterase [Pyrinomonadaceae bacterium]
MKNLGIGIFRFRLYFPPSSCLCGDELFMKKFLKWFGVSLCAMILIIVVLAVYAYFIEPSELKIHAVTLAVPHWSKELNDFKIAAVSDIHGGSNNVSEERLRYLTEQINAQNSDIIVLLGDFVSQDGGKHGNLKMPIETVAANIGGMKAKYGVYAVIGNHDWWYDDAKTRAALEKIGVKVLENQTFAFAVNNQIVTILGIEDFWKHRAVPVQDAMSKINSPENIIAITHNPDSFDQTPASIALVLAGHTHGGQVWIRFYGAPVKVSKAEYYKPHVVKDGRNLFVTSGFGTTGPPFRFLVPPEIAVITLNAAE